MSKYSKAIAGIVGLALLAAEQEYGVDSGYVVETIISIATVLGIWGVPNMETS